MKYELKEAIVFRKDEYDDVNDKYNNQIFSNQKKNVFKLGTSFHRSLRT